eukprot:3594244-Prymnesium_polylepis.1
MSMFHLRVPCPCSMSMFHLHVPSPCSISMFHLHVPSPRETRPPAAPGSTWTAAEASKRLEAAIAYEDTWLTNRAIAQAKAAAGGSGGGGSGGGGGGAAAAAAPEQDNGAPARRSKRARGS